jgi:hypothetical protein
MSVKTALGIFPQYANAQHTSTQHMAPKQEHNHHHHHHMDPQISQQSMYPPMPPPRGGGAFPQGSNAFAHGTNAHGSPHSAPVNRTQQTNMNQVHNNNNNNNNNNGVNNFPRGNNNNINEHRHPVYNHPQPSGMPQESLNTNNNRNTPTKPARGGRAGGARRGAHNNVDAQPLEQLIPHRGSPVLGPQTTNNYHNQPQFEQRAHTNTNGGMPGGYGNFPQDSGSPGRVSREGPTGVPMMRGKQQQNNRSRGKGGP